MKTLETAGTKKLNRAASKLNTASTEHFWGGGGMRTQKPFPKGTQIKVRQSYSQDNPTDLTNIKSICGFCSDRDFLPWTHQKREILFCHTIMNQRTMVRHNLKKRIYC